VRVVPGDGLAPAHPDPASDGGLCPQPDLATSGIGDGGGARTEQARHLVGAADDCQSANGLGATAGLSARVVPSGAAGSAVESDFKGCWFRCLTNVLDPQMLSAADFVLFAANFIRWAMHWLAQQALPAKNAIDVRKLGTKWQVKVAAHVSAQVIQKGEGKLLKFSQHSAFAGKALKIAPDSLANRTFVKT